MVERVAQKQTVDEPIVDMQPKKLPRRRFLKITAAALGAAGLGLGLRSCTQEDEVPPITDEQALLEFMKGKPYWHIISHQSIENIPRRDRLALGRLMHEIDERVPIRFAQEHGGVTYDAVTRLRHPDTIEHEAFKETIEIQQEAAANLSKDEYDQLRQIISMAEYRFHTTIRGGQKGQVTGSPDTMVITAIDAA